GRVASVVAQKLAAVAEGRQVLCVTHLAPIAARAGHHVRVTKTVRAGRSRVALEGLAGDARVEEIARMLAGERVTDTAPGQAGESVDALLPEAFAVARDAARRTVGMRPFDVQLIGGMVLHEGKIAEMATGEGKTLVATLPAYLNGLTGRGVHIVTVNDYLAKRDAQWMGPIYHALGLTVGVIQHEASFRYDPAYVTSDVRMTALRPCARQEAYRAAVTYGT